MKTPARIHDSTRLASQENMLGQGKAFLENISRLALTDNWTRDFINILGT